MCRRLKLLDQLYDVLVLDLPKDGDLVLEGSVVLLDLALVDHLQGERQLPGPVEDDCDCREGQV